MTLRNPTGQGWRRGGLYLMKQVFLPSTFFHHYTASTSVRINRTDRTGNGLLFFRFQTLEKRGCYIRECAIEAGNLAVQREPERSGAPARFAISLTLPAITRLQDKQVTGMNMQVVKWCVNLAMGMVFLLSSVTGFFKFTLLVRMFGLSGVVLPIALMSDIHDWAGISLCFFVAVHLFLNRSWILSMTKTMLNGRKGTD